jgi:hypothetical protein
MVDKKAAAQLALKERSRGKRFKLPEGDTTFRVLPNAADIAAPEFVEYGMHSEVGPRKAFLRCGKAKSGKGTCWLCDSMIPKLQQSGKAVHAQVADRIQRKDIFAVQIAYLDPTTDRWIGPVLWETPNRVANELLNIMQRRNISDPEKGYNLTISRTGTGMKDTRYLPIDKEDDPSEVEEAIMSKLKPFREVVRKYDEAAMKAAYYGHEQEDASETEAHPAEEAPAPVRSKKPVSEVAAEGNGDLDVLEDLDEEPTPTPVKAKARPAPVAVAEEEDDADLQALEEFESDVPDLEEEDAPKAKPAKKTAKAAVVVEEEPEVEEEAPKPAPKKSGKPKPAAPPPEEDDF